MLQPFGPLIGLTLASLLTTCVAHAQPAQERSPTAATDSPQSWLVRDPVSGKLFRQQIVDVQVPTRRWESKPVTTTVYEARSVLQHVSTPTTVFVPHTQYVMQPRVRGLWNPFRQPVQTYEFVPVTTWQPRTQALQHTRPVQQWVPTQQTVYVPQAVDRTETRQQLVQTEIPQPVPPALPGSVGGLYASRPLPPSVPAFRNLVSPVASSGLRPITAPSRSRNYQAPLRTAASSGAHTRDAYQAGMAATVLR